ncbi:hypothetical protein DMH12_05465 [Streptomyces sp. WAC 04229]|nr:hypothetical protein DMH12_05465 [Streptomyces sp. WAC 04229]
MRSGRGFRRGFAHSRCHARQAPPGPPADWAVRAVPPSPVRRRGPPGRGRRAPAGARAPLRPGW